MTRSKLREHCFKMLFCADFSSIRQQTHFISSHTRSV